MSFRKEELVSLYQQSIRDNEERLIKVIKVPPLKPFLLTKVITEEQKDEWSVLPRADRCKKLIEFVLEKNELGVYIKFSRCVQYIKEFEAERIFTFIPDLLQVGLHDPLQGIIMTGPSVLMGCREMGR